MVHEDKTQRRRLHNTSLNPKEKTKGTNNTTVKDSGGKGSMEICGFYGGQKQGNHESSVFHIISMFRVKATKCNFRIDRFLIKRQDSFTLFFSFAPMMSLFTHTGQNVSTPVQRKRGCVRLPLGFSFEHLPNDLFSVMDRSGFHFREVMGPVRNGSQGASVNRDQVCKNANKWSLARRWIHIIQCNLITSRMPDMLGRNRTRRC